MKVLLLIYQWFIAWPVNVILTVITAILTIILSPLFPNHPIAYFPARWWGKLVCWIFLVNIKMEGVENLNLKRSAIIIANHQSMFDILAIYGWLPNIFKWMMKAELRKVPAIGQACEAAGHIFVNRDNPLAAKKSIEKAEKQLINGVSVVIFPEGTRSRTGKMGRFKKGAFKMAEDLSLPIVPITIRGSFERMSKKPNVIIPGTVRLIVHQPIEPNAEMDQSKVIQHAHDVINSGLLPL